jgi:hypothetical protein
MSRLRQKFEDERASNAEFRSVIEALQFYTESIDQEPLGLEKKLELGNRQLDIPEALRAKELFVKCMTRFSLAETAQKVIAYCLGEIAQLYKARVTPLIQQDLSHQDVDAAVIELVIQPVLQQLEVNFLDLMPQEIHGMIYYLTANCFLDWHAKR